MGVKVGQSVLSPLSDVTRNIRIVEKRQKWDYYLMKQGQPEKHAKN